MENSIYEIIQCRLITEKDIQQIIELINAHPTWNRTRLSRELCTQWNWTNARGQLKDMACRTLLLKLEAKHYIQLPTRQHTVRNENRNKNIQYISHWKQPIETSLKNILPLKISVVKVNSNEHKLFCYLLHRDHYLSYQTTVGENMKYLVTDKNDRILSCLLFGSAAWRVADRDEFIGWSEYNRKAKLQLLTNNSRFLIMDWVRVPNLASYILSRIAKRISNDFMDKYGHPVYLLETFVEKQRFNGSCYKAANWIHIGQTRGRSRNDRYTNLVLPVKSIFICPLIKQFLIEMLCVDKNIPIMGGCLDGNSSDKENNNAVLTNINRWMARHGIEEGAFIYIADSAMVTEKNLSQKGKNLFITRLPFSYNECNRIIEDAIEKNAWTEIGVLAQTKAPKDRPHASYKVCDSQVELYGVTYRAIVVHSSAHNSRRIKRIDKEIDKAKNKLSRIIKEQTKTSYYCLADARKAAQKLEHLKISPYHKITTTIHKQVTHQRGRPKKNQPKKIKQITYVIEANLVDLKVEIDKKKNQAGWDRKQTEKPTSFMMSTKFSGILVATFNSKKYLVKKLSDVQLEYLYALELNEDIFTDHGS